MDKQKNFTTGILDAGSWPIFWWDTTIILRNRSWSIFQVDFWMPYTDLRQNLRHEPFRFFQFSIDWRWSHGLAPPSSLTLTSRKYFVPHSQHFPVWCDFLTKTQHPHESRLVYAITLIGIFTCMRRPNGWFGVPEVVRWVLRADDRKTVSRNLVHGFSQREPIPGQNDPLRTKTNPHC